ncbi:hypothetical protein WL35_09810 [Burkholderia ubonensis]|nr:hypothetical protein WL35_09810 [Burkholderia ubonensis]
MGIVELFGHAPFRIRDAHLGLGQRVEVVQISRAKRPVGIEPGDDVLLPDGESLRPRMNFLEDRHGLLPYQPVATYAGIRLWNQLFRQAAEIQYPK